jgi:predicted nucleic acid-binding protein
MRYLIDTNVLLRRTDADSADHLVCSQAVNSLLKAWHDPCICAQVLIEFWAVSTRPKDVNGLALTPAVASQQVSDFQETFTRLPEPPDMAELWQAVAEVYSVRGKQAHDARIAAIMLAHNVTNILTLNPDDFVRAHSRLSHKS